MISIFPRSRRNFVFLPRVLFCDKVLIFHLWGKRRKKKELVLWNGRKRSGMLSLETGKKKNCFLLIPWSIQYFFCIRKFLMSVYVSVNGLILTSAEGLWPCIVFLTNVSATERRKKQKNNNDKMYQIRHSCQLDSAHLSFLHFFPSLICNSIWSLMTDFVVF